VNVRRLASIVGAVAMLVLFTGPAAACTGITLTARDGTVVRGRTMEFAEPLNSNILVIPRGYAFKGLTPDGKEDGLAWTGKYAVTGANGVDLPIVIDGLNEKGLGGGIFYFRGYDTYQAVTADNRDEAMAPWQLLTWALTSFTTVDEVEAALPDVVVGPVTLGAWGIVPPVHYYLEDATGKAIVVEYVDGRLNIHDDLVGVVTNAPTFDWQMTNLSNYVALSNEPNGAIDVSGATLDPSSTGGNLLGLPGDFSSASRFVRAAAFRAMTPEQVTGDDAIRTGFHILDQFDIPLGAVPEPKGSNPPYEITEWTTMSDLTHQRFYIWTEENRDVRTIDLNAVPLDGKEIVTYKLDQPQRAIDVAA
jgi:choloylglycine hydrolase